MSADNFFLYSNEVGEGTNGGSVGDTGRAVAFKSSRSFVQYGSAAASLHVVKLVSMKSVTKPNTVTRTPNKAIAMDGILFLAYHGPSASLM